MIEPWKHDFATVNNVRLHYVTQGDGELALLLHGFPEFWYSWRHQIPELAKHFRVVAPDLRGYNLSDKPRGIANYRIDVLVEDISALIRFFGARRAIIVGHDWGGDIAWTLAARHPEGVERLVVMNAPHPAVFAKHLRTNLRQILRSWYILYFQIPWLPEKLIQLNRGWFVRRAFRGMAIRKDAFPDAALGRFVKAIEDPRSLTASINYYRAEFWELVRRGSQRIAPIPCPTLIIWGEADVALGKELTYDLAPYFSNGFEIRYIPRCSHWVQQEQPELVNRYLLDFLLASH